jgi:hypothetical protein
LEKDRLEAPSSTKLGGKKIKIELDALSIKFVHGVLQVRKSLANLTSSSSAEVLSCPSLPISIQFIYFVAQMLRLAALFLLPLVASLAAQGVPLPFGNIASGGSSNNIVVTGQQGYHHAI